MEDAKGRRWSETASDVAAAAGTAWVALALGDPGALVAAAGSAPIVSHGLSEAISKVQRHRQQQAERALAMSAKAAGVEPDELVARLTQDPLRVSLLATALDGAARTIAEDKIAIFAAALRNGALLDDDARIDLEIVYARTFADLEAPHIRVLYFLKWDPELPDGGRVARRAEIAREAKLGEAVSPVFATLERHALIRTVPPDEIRQWGMARHYLARAGVLGGRQRGPDDAVWMLTKFGRGCLRRLEDASV